MQRLRRLSTSPEASLYLIEDDTESPLHRYVASTPGSREVCNRPEICGCAYTDALRVAVTATLRMCPFRSGVQKLTQTQVCVLNFLRGGLNFDLRNALSTAYGLNAVSSVFMSSQRRLVDGVWQVREDAYRKLRIPDEAYLFVGDVVATGVTMAHGLEVVLEQLTSIGKSLRGLVFFTIGCENVEHHLRDIDAHCRRTFPNYEATSVVYFEGRFRLVHDPEELRIGIPGTDLIRRDCLVAPEFAASQDDRCSNPLERCVIYDAGSRAFDIQNYIDDVAGYWREVASLAEGGFTLREALEERWPDAKTRWTGDGDEESLSAESLSSICRERISTLESILRTA